MHNPESAPTKKNDTHTILWDFEIKTDHLISARRLNIVMVRKKRTCRPVDFNVPDEHMVKLMENEKRDKYLDLAWELNNL